VSRVAVVMPVVGYDQPTARIAGWLKAIGDRVARGEPIAEIETEKVTVELEATAAGTILELVATVGDDVAVGEPIAWLDDAG
jgi:pyruvate dehydrogenase E2 component (dihydrolipoyllysine-residue acetyltransferase)